MNRPAYLLALLLLSLCQVNIAIADEHGSSAKQDQNNSVESFFQIENKTPDGSSVSKDKCETKKKKSTDKLLFKVLDNIGIPMPLKTIEGLDPGIVSKVSGTNEKLAPKQPDIKLERIQVPDQNNSADNSGECPNKIPKSELEGTMYDSAATSNDKKQSK